MPTHHNVTALKITKTLRDQLRAVAVANHMPMTKVIEAALASYTSKAKPATRSHSATTKPSNRSLAMSRAAVALADGVTLDRTDNGTEYVTVPVGDLCTLTLTPEKHNDGTIDVLLSVGSATLVIGQITA